MNQLDFAYRWVTRFKELLLDKETPDNLNETAAMRFDEVANAKAQLVEQTLINLGFRVKIEDLNTVDAWMGSLPGNIGRFVRRPMVSCANLVHMMSISDIWAGDPRNKYFQAPPLITHKLQEIRLSDCHCT